MISLGQASNYSPAQVVRHTFACATSRASHRLRSALAQRYHAPVEHVALYHTGRSALAAAIKSVAPDGADVILPGLTCIAVVRAIKAAGCRPVFVDITADTLEYDYAKLAETLANLQEKCRNLHLESRNNPEFRNDPEPYGEPESHDGPEKQATPIDKTDNLCYNRSIILVQNTLGISWNVSKIEDLASQYHAIIVEDLAHCAGRFYPDGREVGMIGDAIAMSFGKGKSIDTISGGAVIVRHGQMQKTPHRLPRLSDRLRDRWYPLLASVCRGLWRIQIGRYFMAGLVRIGFVQRSADAELNLDHRLTHWQAALAYRQFRKLPTTPLRDFRLVHDRPEVLTKLKRHGYNFDETWYESPVSPVRYADEADFPTETCPETVKIAASIVNIPTWYSASRLDHAIEIIEESKL